jgi:hypothetical protein
MLHEASKPLLSFVIESIAIQGDLAQAATN